MEDKIEFLLTKLEKKLEYSAWRELAEVLLARLICFNKRRANEPSQMLVDKFKSRPKWNTANEDLVKCLKPFEKQLMQKYV